MGNMGVTFLSGGTGTPKLLDSAEEVLEDFAVVVNTADDVFVSGNLVCPDIDTVLYTLSDRIDRSHWWGIEGDTEVTHGSIVECGGLEPCVVDSIRPLGRDRSFVGAEEFMTIGDRDRATHILRTELLDTGFGLTEATKEIADSMGLDALVLPMTDDAVSTWINSVEGDMHFQEWLLRCDAEPEIVGVEFRGIQDASPTDPVLGVLDHPVVIGPSNPVTSIGPILSLDGVEEKLGETTVVAISPFVGGEVVSGPAAELMASVGLTPDSTGVYEAYSGFLDVLVVDEKEEQGLEESLGCDVIRANTLIKDRISSQQLLEKVMSCF